MLKTKIRAEQAKHPQRALFKAGFEMNKTNLKKLSDGGVRIALGTDSGGAADRFFIQGFSEHREMELMVQSGLTPMQVIQSFSKGASGACHFDDGDCSGDSASANGSQWAVLRTTVMGPDVAGCNAVHRTVEHGQQRRAGPRAGLVWEKSPATAPLDWLNAQFHCNQSAVGGRRGWRLPTLQDISSLIDPNAPSSVVIPVLPAGHPFTNVLANAYWSATTNAGATDEAWGTNFNGAAELRSPKTDSLRVWCVRGGQGSDPQ